MLRTATWTCSDAEVTFASKQRPSSQSTCPASKQRRSSQSEANDSDADGHSQQLMLVAAASTVWTRGPRSAQDQRRRGQDSKEVCSGITLSRGGQAHGLAESGQHALLRQADAELPSQGPARHQQGGRQPSMEGRQGDTRASVREACAATRARVCVCQCCLT